MINGEVIEFVRPVMSGSQYDLPGVTVGREFVKSLTSEVRLLIDNSAVSDHWMMFCPVML